MEFFGSFCYIIIALSFTQVIIHVIIAHSVRSLSMFYYNFNPMPFLKHRKRCNVSQETSPNSELSPKEPILTNYRLQVGELIERKFFSRNSAVDKPPNQYTAGDF